MGRGACTARARRAWPSCGRSWTGSGKTASSASRPWPSRSKGRDGLPEPQNETSVVEREIRVEAAPETVFPYFTDPEKMVRWIGVGATLDPRPGGVFYLDTIVGHSFAGEYLTVEPYSRIVFTWGFGNFPDEQNPLPPG